MAIVNLPIRLRPFHKLTVGEYQQLLHKRLSEAFPSLPVRPEWAAMRDERGLYSPRLDTAVGPFATNTIHITDYDRLVHDHHRLLRRWFDLHSDNLQDANADRDRFDFDHACHRNQNARCFLAFEIENRVSQKHLMGGAINAAALGRLGIAVAWNTSTLQSFIRLRSYLLFLSSVGKNSFDPSNLLILTASQLMGSFHEMKTLHRGGRT